MQAPVKPRTYIDLLSINSTSKSWAVHYVSPTDDNRYQAQKMKTHGLFSDVHDEVGHIIVADVSAEGVKALLTPDRDRLNALIQRQHPYAPVDAPEQIPERTTA
jgi:isocitrate lyase